MFEHVNCHKSKNIIGLNSNLAIKFILFCSHMKIYIFLNNKNVKLSLAVHG